MQLDFKFEKWTYVLSRRDEQTTVTEDNAIAADAIHGWSSSPTGMNTPAAIGMPTKL